MKEKTKYNLLNSGSLIFCAGTGGYVLSTVMEAGGIDAGPRLAACALFGFFLGLVWPFRFHV